MKKILLLIGLFFSGTCFAETPFKFYMEGEIGQFSGKAVIQSPKGWSYVGSVKNGRPHGNGVKILNSGVVIYGEWTEGELIGDGAIYNPAPFDSIKAGNINQDKVTGDGVLIIDGEVYEGTFGKYGAPHGNGICIKGKERNKCEYKHGARLK